jgi:hypothetical protein
MVWFRLKKYLLTFGIELELEVTLEIQLDNSIAICGGYVLKNSKAMNIKTGILGPN